MHVALQAADVLQGLEQLKVERGWRIGLSLSGEGRRLLRLATGAFPALWA